MRKIIHNIRRQPEEVRLHILHALMGLFAVILISLWVYSLGTNLTNSNTQVKIGQDLKPFSALKDNMVGGYNNISQPGVDSSGSTSTDSGTIDPNADLKTQENSL